MRQVGDMLVWLALILVVAGVVYYTPRIADYVAREQADRGAGGTSRMMAYHQFGSLDSTP
jgi:hypothetical protein